MRSPEFRRDTGFIKRRTTNNSYCSSEEDLSSYRNYEHPLLNAHKFVSPSLSRQRDVGREKITEKVEREQSSSSFDEFEMNSSLGSSFRQPKRNNQPANESSFSLSPYEQSSEEEYDYSKEKVRDTFSKNKANLRSQEVTEERNYRQYQEKSRRSEEKPGRQRMVRVEEKPLRQIQEKVSLQSKPKSPPKKEQKPKYQPSSDSESSSFSLDSDSELIRPQEPLKQRVRSQRTLQAVQSISSNQRSRPTFQEPSDKTATFNKLKPQIIGHSYQTREQQSAGEESQQEELISVYDTKDFKGGSMKQRVLDSAMNMQRRNYMQREPNNYKMNKVESVRRHNKIVQRSSSDHSSSDFNSQQKRQPYRMHKQMKQPEREHREFREPEKFQIDVKARNMTLAEAFEIRCGRLKRRLEEEREEFKKGNFAKLYKELHQQQQNDYGKINGATKPDNPYTKKMQRLALGIRSTVDKKQMAQMTKKKYRQLPEVKQKMNEERKKQDLLRRRLNVKKMDRQVRLRMKYAAKRR